ncbi:MAG: peptidylprolyl isomerase [Saprospiraceae bacterium]|nr:peptidylprolyl isomerase [Saprospiraceae bacterium]
MELSEIVYKPRINETQKKLAKEKLEKIILRLKNGEDFSKIATIQSDDPGSAKMVAHWVG